MTVTSEMSPADDRWKDGVKQGKPRGNPGTQSSEATAKTPGRSGRHRVRSIEEGECMMLVDVGNKAETHISHAPCADYEHGHHGRGYGRSGQRNGGELP